MVGFRQPERLEQIPSHCTLPSPPRTRGSRGGRRSVGLDSRFRGNDDSSWPEPALDASAQRAGGGGGGAGDSGGGAVAAGGGAGAAGGGGSAPAGGGGGALSAPGGGPGRWCRFGTQCDGTHAPEGVRCRGTRCIPGRQWCSTRCGGGGGGATSGGGGGAGGPGGGASGGGCGGGGGGGGAHEASPTSSTAAAIPDVNPFIAYPPQSRPTAAAGDRRPCAARYRVPRDWLKEKAPVWFRRSWIPVAGAAKLTPRATPNGAAGKD